MLNLSDNLRVLVKDGFVSTALSMSAAECVTINGRPGIPLCSWLLSISLNLLNQYWTVRTATVPFPSTWHIFRRVSSFKFLFPILKPTTLYVLRVTSRNLTTRNIHWRHEQERKVGRESCDFITWRPINHAFCQEENEVGYLAHHKYPRGNFSTT